MSDGPRLASDRGYVVDTQVAIRTEPFGALCYLYGNCNAYLLRSPAMAVAVAPLGDAPRGDGLDAAGSTRAARCLPGALNASPNSGVIHER